MFFSKKKSTRKSRFWTNFTKNNKNWKQTENNCLKKYVENVTIPLLRQILHYFMLFYFIQNQSLIAVLSGSWTPRLSYFNLWSSFWFCVSCPSLLQKGEISSFFCQNFTKYTYKIFKIIHYARVTHLEHPPWWLRTIWSSPTCMCGRYTSWNQRNIRQSSWKSREHFKISIS